MLSDNEIRLKIAQLKGWYLGDNKQAGLDHYDRSGEIPRWPTNIAAAWELVEDARAAEVGVLLHNSLTVIPVPGIWSYTCAFYDPIGGPAHKRYSAEADTAARAICLAWLKLKGVEVE